MKKKKVIIISSIVVVAIVGGLFLVKSLFGKKNEQIGTSTKDVVVGTETIQNTITSSGQVTSTSVDLSLSTSKKFSKLYYTENTFVAKGTKIMKYTNGTYVKAPYDLVIVSYSLPDSGEYIRNQHYIEVKPVNCLEMTLSIDEEDINKVKTGQEVNITINAFEDNTYTGTISSINQIGSYSSSGTTFTAVVTFTNDGNIKIGMSGSVSVIVEEAEDVVAVPIEAIQTSGGQKYVVVVSNGETKNVTVTTGISNAAYVEITSGLSGGETVRLVDITSSSNTSNSFGYGNRGDSTMPSFDGNMPSGGTYPSGSGKTRSN